MSVIAKFFCAEKTETTSGIRIKMHPVSRGEENKTWAAYTPAGTLEMGVLNPAACEAFVVGQEYFLTFELAPKPA